MPQRKRTFEECIERRRQREQRPREKRMAELEAKLKLMQTPVPDEDEIITDLIGLKQRGEAGG